ncbi:MAG: hypothetical protein JNL38_00990, partial [Myxococcales bacterium]|nr:hypothetical protein [Myxococcales bacterium]
MRALFSSMVGVVGVVSLVALAGACANSGGGGTVEESSSGDPGSSSSGGGSSGGADGGASSSSSSGGSSSGSSCTPSNPNDPFDDKYQDENCDGTDGVAAKCVFVSASKGNDTGANGDRAKPFKTINAAIQFAAGQSPKKSVCVSAETYAENVVGASGVSIYGSFDEQDAQWKRSKTRGGMAIETVVNATGVTGPGAGTGILFETVAEETHVEGLTVNVSWPQSAKDGASLYGVRVLAGVGPLFVRNDKIVVGDGHDGADGAAGGSYAAAAADGKIGGSGCGPCGNAGSGGAAPNCPRAGGRGGNGAKGSGNGGEGGSVGTGGVVGGQGGGGVGCGGSCCLSPGAADTGGAGSAGGV